MNLEIHNFDRDQHSANLVYNKHIQQFDEDIVFFIDKTSCLSAWMQCLLSKQIF
jgi:transposase-like protein